MAATAFKLAQQEDYKAGVDVGCPATQRKEGMRRTQTSLPVNLPVYLRVYPNLENLSAVSL